MDFKFKNILLIALLGMMACSDHPSLNNGEEQEQIIIHFNGALPGNKALHPSSRAYDDTWDIADRVGIYMLNSGNSSSETWVQRLAADNELYITDNTATATSVDFIPGEGTTPLCYPSGRAPVNFVAYYPYMAGIETDATNPHVYPVNVGTASGTSQVLKNIDLLYAAPTETDLETEEIIPVDYNSRSGEVSLVFNHQLTKLTINISGSGPEAGRPGFDDDPSLTISGMATTAKFDLATGALSNLGGTDKTITPVFDATTNTASFASWEAIIIPQPAAGEPVSGDSPAPGAEFIFTFDGVDFVFELPASHTFAPGTAYAYDLELIDKDIVFVRNTITPWNAGALVGDEDEFELTPNVSALLLTWDGENTVADASAKVDFAHEAMTEGKVIITRATFSVSDSETPEPETRAQQRTAITWLTPMLQNGSIVLMTQPNEGDITRTAYIHVKATKSYFSDLDDVMGQEAGEQTFVIKVEQESLHKATNCYLLAPGETQIIFMGRVAQHVALSGDTDAAIAADDILVAEQLWTDNENLIASLETVEHGTAGSIKVTVAPGQYGNAGIAVKVGDVIKWSWHIWVPQVDDIADLDLNGWMDRNLGAITNTEATVSTLGLLYQWGRKDPFAGSTSVTAPVSSATLPPFEKINIGGTPALSIKNPTTFYYSSWIGTNGDNSWKPNEKTIYDPCPEGYIVPSNSAWGTLNSSNSTTLTNAGWLPLATALTRRGEYNVAYGGYYPAAGGRFSSGNLSYTGSNGDIWSSSTYNSISYNLNFAFSSVLKTQHTNSRYCGISVRCIRHV